MGKSQRADIIKHTHKVLKKHFTAVSPPKDRSVLEHLLFACLLEDARHEVAEACFARVQQTYYDWNEIRVTTVRELGDVFHDLPNPAAAATRLKSALQRVFETLYQFDLEDLRKQKLGDATKRLVSLKGSTPFCVAYVVQNALGGHAIPLGRGSLEVAYVSGMASRAEIDKGSVPGLERAIPKNKGAEFASLLHCLGAEWIVNPRASKTRSILSEIDSESTGRIDQLLSEESAAPAAAAPETLEGKATPAKVTPKTPPGKGKGPKKGTSAPPKSSSTNKAHPQSDKVGKGSREKKTKAGNPPSKSKKPTVKNSKAPSKQLARRKPR